jgi:hypothetical protein
MFGPVQGSNRYPLVSAEAAASKEKVSVDHAGLLLTRMV